MEGEYFQNIYPFEALLPDIKEEEIQGIVKDCDYTYEANLICEADNIDNEVNIPDAIVFYKMGYMAAQERIEKILRKAER